MNYCLAVFTSCTVLEEYYRACTRTFVGGPEYIYLSRYYLTSTALLTTYRLVTPALALETDCFGEERHRFYPQIYTLS